MKFVFRRIESLPRLSWCAEVTAGSADVIVHHGSWVETRSDRFFEGAWNGSFEQGDFDLAPTFVGSGGLLRDGQLIFSPPTDTYVWLASMRTGNRVLVSNSLAFLMASASDKPSSSYPWYFFDVIQCRRWGLRRKPLSMPTHNGNWIDLHPWNNFRVNADLTIQTLNRVLSDDFQTYDEYQRLLSTTVRSVVENAAHKDRIHSFRPVAAVSQGYDSPAVAVLMAQAGCTEALTFFQEPASQSGYTDNGEEIARHLGMQAQVYHEADYQKRNDLTDAEFCATPTAGMGAPWVLAEKQLRGAILGSGRPGDLVWNTDERFNLPELMAASSDVTLPASLMEFRLRNGFLNFEVPFIGAVHRASLQRITESKEMEPWRVKGDYNRPIPRRMLEEAGLPGSAFGQRKLVSAIRGPSMMPEAARRDFESFFEYQQDVPPAIRRGKLPLWEYRKAPLDILYAISFSLPGRKKRLFRWLLPLTLRSDRRALNRVPLKALYLFHWGFERIENRYIFNQAAKRDSAWAGSSGCGDPL